MDALFGVVNIPNVVWIDEAGIIVRPAEPGWPGGRHEMPRNMLSSIPKLGRAPDRPAGARGRAAASPASPRDRTARPIPMPSATGWPRGAERVTRSTPEEVVAHSQERSPGMSEGAAHFELANHLWRAGQRDLAIGHFNECHRLQPANWTYKRQAWSLVGNERVGGDFGRFAQAPVEGEEGDWPFTSDFFSDVACSMRASTTRRPSSTPAHSPGGDTFKAGCHDA